MKPLAPNVLIQQRYLIVHLIGKGGMGEVYLAVDQRLGSAVALKRTFFSDDELLANAFEREARILANLRHPILPKVSDHFIEGENQFLVMEHITGDDLAKRLEKTGQPFPLSWVLFWADQLLDALHYLHTHTPPIIHRDIKPQNLKLTNDNHIVLLDFGLSKNSVGETKVSSTGSVVGYTPHYAPMEQIRGTGTNDRSDLYSLSATIYQLLTNIVPPDALTRADSLLSGLPDPIKPIDELNEEVSAEVSRVILNGMQISQDKRFSNAREMQKALRDAYAKLQSVMSAQTVAFNVKEHQADGAAAGNASKTPIEAPVSVVPLAGDEATPIEQFRTVTAEDPDPVSSRISSLDPEATLQISEEEAAALRRLPVADSQPDAVESTPVSPTVNEDEPRPSDIRTEVLLAGESPAIQAAQEGRSIPGEDYSPGSGNFGAGQDFQTADDLGTDGDYTTADDFSTSEDSFSTGADFSTREDLSGEERYSPDATVPLINFGGDNEKDDAFADQDTAFEEDFSDAGDSRGGDTAGFYTVPAGGDVEAGVAGGTVPTYGAEAAYTPESEAAFVKSEPTPVKPPVKKKSGGKTFAIIGGLAALFILVIATIGGVAWFVLKPGETSGGGIPPSPEETITASPSPVETPFQIGANTDTGNDLPVNVESNVNKTPGGQNSSSPTGQTTQPTPVRPTPRPRVTTPPPRTPDKPPPTRPKPTPKPTNRTGIIH